jgi:hypothetical protein
MRHLLDVECLDRGARATALAGGADFAASVQYEQRSFLDLVREESRGHVTHVMTYDVHLGLVRSSQVLDDLQVLQRVVDLVVEDVEDLEVAGSEELVAVPVEDTIAQGQPGVVGDGDVIHRFHVQPRMSKAPVDGAGRPSTLVLAAGEAIFRRRRDDTSVHREGCRRVAVAEPSDSQDHHDRAPLRTSL